MGLINKQPTWARHHGGTTQTKMDLIKDFFALNKRERLTEKYPLYSQEDKKADTLVIAKYLFPASSATWYVFEVSQEGDNFTFFGFVTGLLHDEMGYFSLLELASVKVNVPVTIHNADTGEEYEKRILTTVERDLHFTPCEFKDVAPEFCERLWGKNKSK